MSMDRLVDVRALGLKTGRGQRVADIDVIVDSGGTVGLVGLVGPNGAGKTTILRLLAGLQRPTEGSGRILGRDIRRPKSGGSERPGYMPQSSPTQPDLPVREWLRYRAALHGIVEADHAALAVMAETGIAPFATHRLGTLSGGWLRRTELAATIVTRPRLLPLDEPTTDLDQGTRAAIWELIVSLAAQDMGVVVNTHDLAEAERCDHLILLIDGAVAANGSPAAMLARAGKTRLEDAWPILMAGRSA